MDIVPVGLAVGARYQWLGQPYSMPPLGGRWLGANKPLMELTQFWESVRRAAHAELRQTAKTQGNGVLADVHFGQLLKFDTAPTGIVGGSPAYLGRHIVIGTVVDARRKADVPHKIHTVVDMRDDLSSLHRSGASNLNYRHMDREGGI